MSLVQITKQRGRIDRVPQGETPVVELDLTDRQTVVSIDLQEAWAVNKDRVTHDWNWTAYIATRL